MSQPKVVLTWEEAKRLGIECCADCGHPRNNHFSFKAKPCAHCKCRRYRRGVRMGTMVTT